MGKNQVPVVVTWVDTYASASWDEAADVNIMPVVQIGWLIQHDETQVKIADTIAREINDEETYYGITAIPASSVKKINYLNREKESVQESPLEEVF